MLPIPTLGLRHLALRVRHLAAAKTFYCEVFGMQVVWEPDADNVYLSTGTDNLALHRVDADLITDQRQPLDHLGFIVRNPEAVHAAALRLQARGVPIISGPRVHRDGSCSLYCTDPEGNRIQILYEPTVSQRL